VVWGVCGVMCGVLGVGCVVMYPLVWCGVYCGWASVCRLLVLRPPHCESSLSSSSSSSCLVVVVVVFVVFVVVSVWAGGWVGGFLCLCLCDVLRLCCSSLCSVPHCRPVARALDIPPRPSVALALCFAPAPSDAPSPPHTHHSHPTPPQASFFPSRVEKRF
jgi:hypothetical protein